MSHTITISHCRTLSHTHTITHTLSHTQPSHIHHHIHHTITHHTHHHAHTTSPSHAATQPYTYSREENNNNDVSNLPLLYLVCCLLRRHPCPKCGRSKTHGRPTIQSSTPTTRR
jgi:hypothetical protein